MTNGCRLYQSSLRTALESQIPRYWGGCVPVISFRRPFTCRRGDFTAHIVNLLARNTVQRGKLTNYRKYTPEFAHRCACQYGVGAVLGLKQLHGRGEKERADPVWKGQIDPTSDEVSLSLIWVVEGIREKCPWVVLHQPRRWVKSC